MSIVNVRYTTEVAVIPIFRPSHQMPHPWVVVMVEGGLASWDGNEWTSQTSGDSGRPLAWTPTWWSPVPHFEPVPIPMVEESTP